MNDRPPKLETIEDWKRRYERIIMKGATDAQIIQQIENDGHIPIEERTAIIADWNARPEQVAAKKRKERTELISMIAIVCILTAIAIWWLLSGAPINIP